ncbi:hypothetical protein L2748_23020 [Shewanella sairae]|uniref:hypothetical protein n=1 Tax=Shewanella sairae TaxID=190310 RepID=UPI00200F0234|nr:hypothetical protein [Shewanella sairae]MCL1132547.1 hypothetical protein [Shewanella sairae]
MKYKSIKAMAHNFTHSFVSLCNYEDGAFVFEDLYTLARVQPYKTVRISWVPTNTEEIFYFTPRIRKSLRYYRDWLPRHAMNHGVDLNKVNEFYTEVYVARNHQIYVRVITVDDRGKKNEQYVYA